jgi:tetrapyrrole methylase family protein / MazG family protein
MPNPPKDLNVISSLLQVVQDLRGPDGCPWDKEQTHQSLAPYAIEETFEMIEALETKSDGDFCDELGDVLFQVVLHSQLAQERGAFQFSDVVRAISEKIVRRHPHVFADLKVKDSAEVLKNWDQIKAEEKKLKAQNNSQTAVPLNKVFKIPKGLPALQAADAIGEKTQKYNFDWFHAAQVLAQLKEEIQELEQAMTESVSPESFAHMEHELGDVLFSAAQLARHLKIEPETALRKTNYRFENRFVKMLEISNTSQENTTALTQDEALSQFAKLSQSEKENLWEQAKQQTND